MFKEPNKIIVFDVETTGLSPNKDQILEIGAVLLEERVITDRFQTFVGIVGGVPYNAEKLTGITNLMLQGKPNAEEALNMFKEFIKNYPLVAHNANFDKRFIDTKGKDYDIDFENECYDTLSMARRLLPTISNHKLNTLCNYFDIDNNNHHRADNDSEVLSQLLVIFLESLKRRDENLERFLVN